MGRNTPGICMNSGCGLKFYLIYISIPFMIEIAGIMVFGILGMAVQLFVLVDIN